MISYYIGIISQYVTLCYTIWTHTVKCYVHDTILPYVDKANQYAGWRYNYDYCESFQFTVYEPDGFYNWHRDGGSDHYAKYKRYIEGISPPRPSNRKDRLPPGYVKNNQLVGKIRKLSMTINLNEPGDYDGGNLKFDFFCLIFSIGMNYVLVKISILDFIQRPLNVLIISILLTISKLHQLLY